MLDQESITPGSMNLKPLRSCLWRPGR